MRSDFPWITIPRERHQFLSDSAADYSLNRPSWHLRQLPNGVNTDLGKPCSSHRTHSPHQLNRQVVKEIQFGLRINDHQPVRLGHLRSDFCEVLGPRHADGDWKAKLCAHATAYGSRNLERWTEKVDTSSNVSKGFIDGNSFDERSEIIEHVDGSITQPLVILEMPPDKNQLWAKLAGPQPRHAAIDSKGLRLIRRSEHHAATDGDRFSAQ